MRRSAVWWLGLATIWTVCLLLPAGAAVLVTGGLGSGPSARALIGGAALLVLPLAWSTAAYVSLSDFLGSERPDATIRWRKSCDL